MRWTFAISLLLFAACASPPTPAAWLGATFAEVRESFGDPEAVMINPSNNRVYVFRGRNEAPSGTDTVLALGHDNFQMVGTGCAIMFEFEEKTVSRWDWSGQHCTAASVLPPE